MKKYQGPAFCLSLVAATTLVATAIVAVPRSSQGEPPLRQSFRTENAAPVARATSTLGRPTSTEGNSVVSGRADVSNSRLQDTVVTASAVVDAEAITMSVRNAGSLQSRPTAALPVPTILPVSWHDSSEQRVEQQTLPARSTFAQEKTWQRDMLPAIGAPQVDQPEVQTSNPRMGQWQQLIEADARRQEQRSTVPPASASTSDIAWWDPTPVQPFQDENIFEDRDTAIPEPLTPVLFRQAVAASAEPTKAHFHNSDLFDQPSSVPDRSTVQTRPTPVVTPAVTRAATPAVAEQSARLAQAGESHDRFKGITELLNQMQQMQQNQQQANDLLNQPPSKPGDPQQQPNTDPQIPGSQSPSSLPESAAPEKAKRSILRAQPTEGNSERFSMQFQDADVSEVMGMLGELAGINILVGKGVTGTVPTVNLVDVTIDEALQAILRSLGYVFERDGEFVFVMTHEDALARKQQNRKLITKIYRPHYISVKDLQALLVPLQTDGVGKIAVTSPNETGLENSAETAGGDQLSQRDAVIVVDYAEVIQEIDAVFLEMDVPPLQVVIEAMILSVRLTDSMQFGVNFALLNGKGNSLLVSGNGGTLNSSTGFPSAGNDTGGSILSPMGEFIADAAGLKYGFIRGDISGFVRALESIADTNLIASPQIRVLNKQKAQLIIGEQLAYTTTTQNGTSSVENVNFLDVGTKLILRPFIAPDGLVRMEIHPEQSSGVIDIRGLPNKATTEVTTNVMVRNGTTVVIGGLIAEQTTESYDRVPFLGALPVIGKLFRSKMESIDRDELIVLITPRIVEEPDAEIEGDLLKYQNERRAETFRHELSPVNRRNLADMELELAQRYFDEGDIPRARRHVDLAIQQSKNNQDAINLRDQIEAIEGRRKRSWLRIPGLKSSH